MPRNESASRLTRVWIGPHGSTRSTGPGLEIDLVKRIIKKSETRIKLNKNALTMLVTLVEAAHEDPTRPVEYKDLEKRIWSIPKRDRYDRKKDAKDVWSDIHGLKRKLKDSLFQDAIDHYIETGPETYKFIGEVWPDEGLPIPIPRRIAARPKWEVHKREARVRQQEAANALKASIICHIPFPEGDTLKFALIPDGTFRMGRTISDDKLLKAIGCELDAAAAFERPAHFVHISRPLYMATAPVTVAQFRTYTQRAQIQESPRHNRKCIVPFPEHWNTVIKERPWTQLGFSASDVFEPAEPGYAFRKGAWWNDVGFPQTDSDPVVNVSWDDADAFCRWLSKETNKPFRLPTEAEWEYACRAGSDQLFFWGNSLERAVEFCNGAGQRLAGSVGLLADVFPAKDQYLHTSPVGVFQPNAWGLFDMLGNASEWCADHAAADHNSYTRVRVRDPIESRGDRRILRGGNWYRGPLACRSAARMHRRANGRSCLTGFRLLLDWFPSVRSPRDPDTEV